MKLKTSLAPHVHDRISTNALMGDVLIALTPAALLSVYLFGWKALLMIFLGMASAVLAEALTQRLTHQPITVCDLSAAVTGLLLAMNLPVGAPLWLPVVGSVIAICIAKQFFGGHGFNIVNPALFGRAVLMTCWASSMSGSALVAPSVAGVDAVSSATALTLLKEGAAAADLPSIGSLFLGTTAGMLGEVSALALLVGGLYLMVRKVISWHIPVSFIGTVGVLALILTGFDFQLALVHILSGGLFLGAFFMATGYGGHPCTGKGKCIFGFGCGLLTILIRFYGDYPEGVSYSILLMNLASPLIDRFVHERVFGEVVSNA